MFSAYSPYSKADSNFGFGTTWRLINDYNCYYLESDFNSGTGVMMIYSSHLGGNQLETASNWTQNTQPNVHIDSECIFE